MRPALHLVRALVVVVLALSAGTTAAETLTLRGDFWCPYNCAPDGAAPGYMVEIARESFGAAGIEVDYDLMPWARVLDEVRAGRIDAAIGALPSDIEGAVLPARALGRSAPALVISNRVPFVYEGPESLARLSVAILHGDTFDGGAVDAFIARSLAAKSAWLTVTGGEDAVGANLRMVLSDRVDATIEDHQVLAWRLAREPLRDKVRLVDIAPPVPNYIVFAPGNPRSARYASLLDAGVDALRRSGRLKAILARYDVADWEQGSPP